MNDATALLRFYETTYYPLRLMNRSAKTDKLYRITINNFARHLGRPATLDDLNDDTVVQFLNWTVRNGRSPATANKDRAQLVAIANLAFRKRSILEALDVLPLTEPSRVPLAWTQRDLSKLFRACEQQTGTVGGVQAGPWWAALHSVLWWTGERVGAVLQLTWDNLDLDSGWLIVPAELRKGKRRDKGFHLPAGCIASLARITKPERTLIFPWFLTPRHIYVHYKRLLKAAGLPHDRKSKFHRMRRSTASHFEAAGGNATELLDHSMRRTTRDYLDPRIVGGQNTSDFLFQPDKSEETL